MYGIHLNKEKTFKSKSFIVAARCQTAGWSGLEVVRKQNRIDGTGRLAISGRHTIESGRIEILIWSKHEYGRHVQTGYQFV
jgi:hypothetical protein